MEAMSTTQSHFFSSDQSQLIKQLGGTALIAILRKMLLIRNFEIRAESAYLQGKIGGFFHSYTGQEAVQTAAVEAMGEKNWWVASYRCHALALLLGATPDEIMAELYGRANGNAKGRGGSMHLYAERMLGGFGIVTGQMPIAIGAAFSSKYRGLKDEVAVCFIGDGAVAQGAFHESLNQAALLNLPFICVIENNQWGMGTHVSRAISVPRLAEDKAPGYGIEALTLDGMDFFNCYAGFEYAYRKVKETSRPILIEAITERFRGHSISDPGLYRSREALTAVMERDPIAFLQKQLLEAGILDMDSYQELDRSCKEIAVNSMKHADNSPWPALSTLEDDVFAP
jgi:pyruvate dehydrogenase E1 component alpha subunit